MVYKVMTELKAEGARTAVFQQQWFQSCFREAVVFVLSMHEEGMKGCWNTAVLEPPWYW